MAEKSSDLQFNELKNLKFSHTPEGVIIEYNNNRFILGYLSISKENVDFTKNQYLSMAEATLKFHCSVRNYPIHKIKNIKPVSIMPRENNYSHFSKYVEEGVFNTFIKKGIWQLGTIEQYRTIENKKQRDEFEGHSFLNLNINNHIVSSIFSTGFNYLILCGTNKTQSKEHKSQFGQKELHFNNVKSFSESVKKSIGAKKYHIQNVEYNTLKLYINNDLIEDPDVDIENILTPKFFEIIKKHLVYPSLFVKPEYFEIENEVRLIFEMNKDYKKPLRFENKQLLDYIKVM